MADDEASNAMPLSLNNYGLKGSVKSVTSTFPDRSVELLRFLQNGFLEGMATKALSGSEQRFVHDEFGRFYEEGDIIPPAVLNTNNTFSLFTVVPAAHRSFFFVVDELPEGIGFYVSNVGRIEDVYSLVGKRLASRFYDPEGRLSSELVHLYDFDDLIESVVQKVFGTYVACVRVKRNAMVTVVEQLLGEILVTTVTIFTDTRGNVIRVERNGQLDRIQHYEFYERGNWIRRETTSSDKTEITHRIIEYWT